jgi:coenzyme F420-reducing hydrogenase delta subunit
MSKLKLALYLIEAHEGCEIGKAQIGRKISNLVEHTTHICIAEVIFQDRVKPVLIQKAMQSGADGVLIFGCRPEPCRSKINRSCSEEQIPPLKELQDQIDFEEYKSSESLSLRVAGDTIWKN